VQRDVSENTGKPKLSFSPSGLGREVEYHRIPEPVPDPEAPGGIKRVPSDPLKGRITRVAELSVIQDHLERKLDSMSEMGEMLSLRLQMAMDRLSKLMSTLSSILKKQSDATQSMTGNLK
jgi:hypothetical protein